MIEAHDRKDHDRLTTTGELLKIVNELPRLRFQLKNGRKICYVPWNPVKLCVCVCGKRKNIKNNYIVTTCIKTLCML